jgi:hypothetical protein
MKRITKEETLVGMNGLARCWRREVRERLTGR